MQNREKLFEEYYEKTGIRLTEEPKRAEEYIKVTGDRMLELNRGAVKNPEKYIPILEKLVKDNPGLPSFKNYLYNAYTASKQPDKAEAILKSTMEAHPDYLFGSLNYVLGIRDEDEMRAAAHYLGENKKLNDLREDKNHVYHVSEFIIFQSAVSTYYTVLGDNRKAADALLPLIELQFEDSIVKETASNILHLRMKRGKARHRKAAKKSKKTKVIPSLPTDVTDEMPNFNHPEVRLFYEVSIEQLKEKDRKKIAALPRETLVEDLEKILQDAIDRYDFLVNSDIDEENTYAPLHALYFLSAFEQRESLNRLLDLMRIDRAFAEYWFTSHFTLNFQFGVFALGKHNLSALADFLKEKNREGFIRSTITDSVAQIAVRYPDRRTEVIAWFKDIFDFYLAHAEDEAYADSDFISSALMELEMMRAVELEDYVRRFDEKGLIDNAFAGTAAQITEEIHKKSHPSQLKPLPENLAEYYDGSYRERYVPRLQEEEKKLMDDIFNHPVEKIILGLMAETLSAVFEAEEEPRLAIEQNDSRILETIKRIAPKVGRNEPCPCGSGKKYKKCCLNKR